MASYFDAQPPSKAAGELLDVPDGHALKSTGMLTPQVSRILEDLDLEEHSSSDDERSDAEDSDAEDSDPPIADNLIKSSSSPSPETKHVRLEPPQQPLGTGSKKRQPHMERFRSLRSILFLSKIENGMAEEQRANAAAAEKWKADHEQRKGLNRPKTPEAPTKSPSKEGFAHRMGDKLKRMTSKEAPTMKNIREEDDNESTASSEDDDEPNEFMREDRGSDVDRINSLDAGDLARWVSRHDPPSDGERSRRTKDKELRHDGSGHESLGNSDVEDIVQWVRRKEPEPQQETRPDVGYSDASTEEDSESSAPRKDTMNDKDVDDLVRWISRREEPNAGPVNEPKATLPLKTAKIEEPDEVQESDGSDLSRRATHINDTSGESDLDGEESAVPGSVPAHQKSHVTRGSLAPDDVDDLLLWMRSKGTKSPSSEIPDEEPRGRSSRREVE